MGQKERRFDQMKPTFSGSSTSLKALLHYALFHSHFLFFTCFSCVFPRIYDTNMLVSKTQEKCKENARKIQNASPTREHFSILHYALSKNTSQLRFARVLLISLTKTLTQRIV